MSQYPTVLDHQQDQRSWKIWFCLDLNNLVPPLGTGWNLSVHKHGNRVPANILLLWVAKDVSNMATCLRGQLTPQLYYQGMSFAEGREWRRQQVLWGLYISWSIKSRRILVLVGVTLIGLQSQIVLPEIVTQEVLYSKVHARCSHSFFRLLSVDTEKFRRTNKTTARNMDK